jgi:DNA-binding CsgD family transcriptional regulator
VLAAAGAGTRRRVAGPAGLTPRELEVLGLIARGATTSEVAVRLGISRKTAGTHIERIYVKTGASSRSTATLFALRSGLIGTLAEPPDSPLPA